MNFVNTFDKLYEVFSQCINDPINVSLSIVMLVFGLCSIIRLTKYKNKIVNEINEFIMKTKKKERDSCKNQNSHKNNNEFFDSKEYLKHSWGEFSETIIEWENSDKEEYEYYHTESASKYFNINSIKGVNNVFSKIDSAPSILTGLGICGTFLGILLGLNLGFSNGELNTNLFIENIRTAFFTSLIGISLSIVFGAWLRSLGDSIQDKMSEISNHIDKLYPHFKTLNFRKRLLTNVKNVDNSLQMLNDDLPKNIARSLVSGVGMEQLTEAASQTINRGLEELIERIKQTSEVHERLNQQSDQLRSHLEEKKNQLKTLVDSNQVIISELNSSLKVTSDNFEKLPVTFDRATSSFVAASDKMNQTSQKIPELTKEFENIYSVSEQKHLRINEEIQKIAISVKEISDSSLKANSNTVESLDTNLTRFDEALSNAVKKLSETINELQDLASIQISNIKSDKEELLRE